jgi:hypothetical protein
MQLDESSLFRDALCVMRDVKENQRPSRATEQNKSFADRGGFDLFVPFGDA